MVHKKEGLLIHYAGAKDVLPLQGAVLVGAKYFSPWPHLKKGGDFLSKFRLGFKRHFFPEPARVTVLTYRRFPENAFTGTA
jgi:hypothetical protein